MVFSMLVFTHPHSNLLMDNGSTGWAFARQMAELMRWGKRGLVLALLLLSAHVATATHFLGGQITYSYIGSNQYQITVKSYWDLQGVPASGMDVLDVYDGSNNYLTTLTLSDVSRDTFPDNITSEHIESGTYTVPGNGTFNLISNSCCRSASGANFNSGNNYGLRGRIVHSSTSNSGPQFGDLAFYYFGLSPISFNMNVNDPENDIQTYSLGVPFGVSTNLYNGMTGFSLDTTTGTFSWPTPVVGRWVVNVRIRERIGTVYTGAFVERDFIISVSPTLNVPPVFDSIANPTVVAGNTLNLTIPVSDPNGDGITLAASGTPFNSGATFSQTNVLVDSATGNFSWTVPNSLISGTYNLVLQAQDNNASPLTAQYIIPITVVGQSPVIAIPNWTWIGGANTPGATANYGTLGVPSVTNQPGSRQGMATWSVGDNFYFFGGNGRNEFPADSAQGDFWRYSATNNQWTWIGGTKYASNFGGVYGTQGVGSVSNRPSSRYGAMTWTVGNLLYLFGGSTPNTNYLSDLWSYNTTTGQWTWLKGPSITNVNGTYGTQGIPGATNNPGARYESTTWVDGNGNLWLFGGLGAPASGSLVYLNDLWRYNPTTNQWAWISGSNIGNNSGVYNTQGVAAVLNQPGARAASTGFTANGTDLFLFGGFGYASTVSTGDMNDLWKYNTVTGLWTWVKGSSIANALGVYGTQGTTNINNTPGAHEFRKGEVDANGNFILIAGYGNNASSTGFLNEVWSYNPINNAWTWIKGTNVVNAAGNYGTLGVTAASNNIPGMIQHGLFKASDGVIYAFGGSYLSNNFNHLWKLGTLSPEPIDPPANIGFSNVTNNSMTIGWSFGASSSRELVVMRAGSPVNALPQDGFGYTPSTVFGSGDQIGTGNYVMDFTFNTSVNVTGLTAGVTYHVAVFSANPPSGSSAGINYLTSSFVAGSQNTLNLTSQFAVPTTPVCAGSQIPVAFTPTGPWDARTTNTFRVTLLTPAGSTPLNPIVYQSAAGAPGGAQTVNVTIPATLATSASYRIRVQSTSPVLSVTSGYFTVNAAPVKPTVTASNGGFSLCGASITLSSTGTYTTRQWFRSNSQTGPFSAITGATAATYATGVSGYYFVQVSNAGNACSININSDTARIQALTTASITPNVLADTFCTGSGQQLCAQTFAGAAYQWFRSSVAQTSAGYNTNCFSPTTSGNYRCRIIVSPTCTIYTPYIALSVAGLPSAAMVNISILNVTGLTAFLCSGDTAKLSVPSANGVTWQWFRNNVAITGANTRSYNATTTGTYTVTVTNAFGCSNTSAGVVLNSSSLPASVSILPSTASICTGGSIVLSVPADTTLNFRWFRNGVAISGATNPTYTASVAATYTVERTRKNSVGCKRLSSGRVLTVVNPTVTISGTLAPCANINAVLTASNAFSFTNFTWYRNGVQVQAGSSTMYTATTSGTYYVVATTAIGCVATSANSVVTILTPITLSGWNNQNFICSGSQICLTGVPAGATIVWRRSTTVQTTNVVNNGLCLQVLQNGSYNATIAYGNCTTVVTTPSLSVGALPTATIGGAATYNVCPGANPTLTATTNGTVVQWYRSVTQNGNGAAQPGTVGATTFTPADSGWYWFISQAVNGCQARSNSIRVNYNVVPVAPVLTSSCVGGQGLGVILYASTSPMVSSYSWYRNGVIIAGANAASYTPVQNGTYTVYGVSAQGCTSAVSNSKVLPISSTLATTSLASSSCNKYGFGLIGDQITATSVSGAYGYRFEFKVVDSLSNGPWIGFNSSTRFFDLTQAIFFLNYNTTYSVRVRLFTQTGDTLCAGTVCQLGIGQVPAYSKLTNSFCGTASAPVLRPLSGSISRDAVLYADLVRYNFWNTATNAYHYAFTAPTSNNLSFLDVNPALAPNATYAVTVEVWKDWTAGIPTDTCYIATGGFGSRETGVTASGDATQAMAYPNPFTDNVMVIAGKAGQMVNVQMTDVAGRVVATTREIAGGVPTSFGEDLATGTYLLHVTMPNGTLQTLRVVKAGR